MYIIDSPITKPESRIKDALDDDEETSLLLPFNLDDWR